MVTFAQLKAVDPAQFEQAADGWHKVSSSAGAAKDRLDNEINAKLRGGLKGQGVGAALGRLQRLSENFHYMQVECALVLTALNGLAAELRAAKKKMDNAVQDAQDAGMTVKEDGSVQYTPPLVLLPGQEYEPAGNGRAPYVTTTPKQQAQGYADRIGDALKDATDADGKYARTLGKLITTADLSVTKDEWIDAEKDRGDVKKTVGDHLRDVPKDKSPKDNAAWWKSLSKEEQAEYISLYPASVGKLDGLPVEDRDEANRIWFNEQRAKYQTELANLPPEPRPRSILAGRSMVPNPEWSRWDSKRKHLIGSLDGMNRIQMRFNSTGKVDAFPDSRLFRHQPRGDGLPPAYLLDFDAEKNGRAIIANGNPDTADHTAVMVGGTKSRLSGIYTPMVAGTNLWQAASAMPGEPKVSTITWNGYDAPQNLFPEGVSNKYADRAAGDFNDFLSGLHTSHDPSSDDHLSVQAHSYGTVVVGSAARQGTLEADDVMLSGTPGVQVGRAEDLDVPPGHVWNQKAQDDLVPKLGAPTHGHHEGLTQFITPNDPIFGAHQMSTDTKGHGNYWLVGSESLENQARVVVGRYDEVRMK
ncbi:alpha/beta hydrolase [Streptomyces sp. ME19-01-6]|uniref:alpha/beta hydrolase n=1 Tax=Streptomyces sp. ME19-01-6 TaxID=3028686 RepID=UPI0029A8FFFC|nr:alpha/beta hydrolase [Streptomyces sp. ME19-01-6]MDX3227961.1 alpha/beta hydrolase [Streptomyces sp. ME19-01-6]